jgi:hypothetical protein
MKRNILLLSAIFALGAQHVFAMSSATYQINADSINSGGNFSTSPSYQNLDSIGEPFTENMHSASFVIGEGLAPMLNYSIGLTVDSSVKLLTIVTPGVPVTGTTTTSVTTDSWGGYDLYISENNNLKHTDTVTTIPSFAVGTIGVPTVWSGVGLGFTVSSATSLEAKWNAGLAYAAIPTVPTIFHTKPGFKSGVDNTLVQYKLDAAPNQKSGTYSNILTYTAIAKL